MKGLIFAIVTATLVAGCSSAKLADHPQVLVGPISRAQLPPEFMAAYDTVHIQPEFVELLRVAVGGTSAVVFLGTWCSDSRRDVPRFFRIVDSTGFPQDRITLHALDRQKQSPDGMATRYGVDRVPTFIFLKDGKEIGRIVEVPKTTLEGDLLSILGAAMQR